MDEKNIKARVNTNLNKRTGLPDVNAPNDGYFKEGAQVIITDIVNGSPYKGNKVWYKLEDGSYVWSGGVEGIKTLTNINNNIESDKKNWWLEDYEIPILWRKGLSGEGIKIAVIDSGLSLPHNDLNININNCIDKSLSKKNGIHDITGHGTHCTGIIKALGNNIKGIAYDSILYFCKVRSDEYGLDLFALKDGIEWAISKKVDIISISIGKAKDSANIQPLFQEAISMNIIPICAGGNYDKTIRTYDTILYPAKYPECISVGAIDQYKNATTGTLTSKNLTIGAPGTDINSTFLNNTKKRCLEQVNLLHS